MQHTGGGTKSESRAEAEGHTAKSRGPAEAKEGRSNVLL